MTRKITCGGITYNSAKLFCEMNGIKYSKYFELKAKGYNPEEILNRIKNKKVLNNSNITDENNIEEKSTKTENVKNKTVEEKRPLRMQNLMIYNLNDALMILNNHPNSKINLIDFENICDNKEKLKLIDHGINDSNCVNIFFFNACIYSNQYYTTIKNSLSTNVQVITMDVEDQLVDHMITYYLGAFLALYPKNTYNIISTDHGYSAFINNLNMQNVGIIGIGEFIPDKEKRYRFSLANYCVKNKYMKDGVCLTRRDLHEVLKDFITKNRTIDSTNYESTLDETLNNLCKYKIFKLTKATDNYDEYYTVDLKVANSIINGYKG